MPPIRQLLSNADEAGDAVRQVIRAYHGSPYDFNKFDASKIGKGEGAQVYGHGLYFAGNEETARHYREALSDDAPFSSPAEAAADYLAASGGNRKMALKILGRHASQPASVGYTKADQANIIRQAYEVLESNADIVPRRRAGHMYEVELGHPEDSLLDWDAPLGKQPTAVGEMLKNRLGGGYFSMMGEPGDGRRMWHHFVDSYGPPKAAQRLVDAGIPGVRYLDQGSRRVGEGTRNYVMFPGTEDSIRILRKYGLLAPVAAGAASQYNDPQ